MFFARRDTLCNDKTELSVVEFHNMHTYGSICCSCFETTGIKEISETTRSKFLEQIRKDNFYVAMPPHHLWKSIGWDQKLTSEC